ncbi:MAG: HAD family phosphatase [Cytophagales bacterium]|nr:HAD family phosphatase [Cytophagales bacterium]
MNTKFMGDQLTGINAIIFDLGGVVIDLDYDRAANQLANLSGLETGELNQLLVSSDILKTFEVGEISENEFRQKVCELVDIQLQNDEFDRIWNSLLGVISEPRVKKMLELKENFKTLVLSNTNAIHLRSFDKTLFEGHGFMGVHELVHQAYYSHEIGMRKPNNNIYAHVLDDQNLSPYEVLFIDDRKDNIEAAQELGIRIYWNENVDDWMKAVVDK